MYKNSEENKIAYVLRQEAGYLILEDIDSDNSMFMTFLAGMLDDEQDHKIDPEILEDDPLSPFRLQIEEDMEYGRDAGDHIIKALSIFLKRDIINLTVLDKYKLRVVRYDFEPLTSEHKTETHHQARLNSPLTLFYIPKHYESVRCDSPTQDLLQDGTILTITNCTEIPLKHRASSQPIITTKAAPPKRDSATPPAIESNCTFMAPIASLTDTAHSTEVNQQDDTKIAQKEFHGCESSASVGISLLNPKTIAP